MRRILTVALFAATAFAQEITPAAKLPDVIAAFNTTQPHDTLSCSFEFLKPQLNLGFRFESAYAVRATLSGYVGKDHNWRIIFQVTPPGGQPVYFDDSINLPAPPNGGFDGIATGSFFTGEGEYDVKLALWDDEGHFCRHSAKVDARRKGNERGVELEMPPGTVGDFFWHPASPQASAAGKTHQVTILMNAALPTGRQVKSGRGRWRSLLTILSSLLESLPDANIRLVVFNWDQQQELFRKDGFGPADLSGIADKAVDGSQWAVDAGVLQNPLGGWDLLGNLEKKEMQATVIFVGLPMVSVEKMPPDIPESGPEQASRFFYLVYLPGATPEEEANARLSGIAPPGAWRADGGINLGGGGGGRGGGSLIPSFDRNPIPLDPIDEAVQRMKGKTLTISSADELGKAISAIKASLTGSH